MVKGEIGDWSGALISCASWGGGRGRRSAKAVMRGNQCTLWQSSTGAIGKHLKSLSSKCQAHKAALEEYQNKSTGYVQVKGQDGQEMMVPVLSFDESFYHAVRATLVIICTTLSENALRHEMVRDWIAGYQPRAVPPSPVCPFAAS